VSLRAKIVAVFLLVLAILSFAWRKVTVARAAQARTRTLRVALYPYIPGFDAAAEYIKRRFEAENPDVTLKIIDTRSDYYDYKADNYIEAVDADIYELDSVMLRDFVASGKIKEVPDEALLPAAELLNTADRASRLDGKRYGAAHWVCRDFLFYPKDGGPAQPVKKLSELNNFVGKDLLIDLRGRSTLGEYYLMAAIDRYQDWNQIYPAKITTVDPDVEKDIQDLSAHCDTASCRSKVLHDYTGTHGAEFARRRGKALVGYSEVLHDVLSESALCSVSDKCLTDGDIAVAELPLDENGSKPMAWVDSFTLSKGCNPDCTKDAVRFMTMMNRDDTYMALLFHRPLSFMNVPKPYPPVPTYLMPAKASLYTNADLLKAAHLYPDLKALAENVTVPTDKDLNKNLRDLGKKLDGDLGP
jgi:thiamine pyridinylase